MWLESGIIAAIAGAIAAGLASLIIRDSIKHRIAHTTVVILIFFGLNGLAREYVLPELRVRRAHQEAEELLQEYRPFLLLAQKHPEFREGVHDLFLEVTREGSSVSEAERRATEWGQSQVWSYFSRYLPVTSSEALVSFFSVNMVEVLGQVTQRGDQRCFGMLTGGVSGSETLEVLTPDEQKRVEQALADVIEAAPAKQEFQASTAKQLQADLDVVVADFVAKEGPKSALALAALGNPERKPDDPLYVCRTMVSFYRKLLALHEPRRTALLRYFVSVMD